MMTAAPALARMIHTCFLLKDWIAHDSFVYDAQRGGETDSDHVRAHLLPRMRVAASGSSVTARAARAVPHLPPPHTRDGTDGGVSAMDG